MNGLSIPLIAAFIAQFIVGFPLILPVKLLHAPSIFAYKSVSQGNGMYVGATITAIFSVVMMTCIYEAFTLHQKEHESDSKAWMLDLSKGRAQLNVILCAINVVLAITFVRLAREVDFHDRLKRSHEALQKQAGGLAEEYNRATSAMDKTGDEGATNAELKQRLAGVLSHAQSLQDEVEAANEAKEKAEKEVEQIRTQYKSLENSFDELMQENVTLKGGHKNTDKKDT